MSQISNYLRALLAVVLLVAAGRAHADVNAPRREVRSAWVTTAWAIDWPSNKTNESTQKSEAITILDNLKAMGANCVYFQVRSMSDRYYNKTSYTINGTTYSVASEARSKYLAGSWDPLQYWLDEAHKRGMELYAWINPYRAATQESDYNSLSSDLKSLIIKSENAGIWFYNPALSQTNTHICNICRVLAGNYDLDGIVFDDYFYANGITTDDANGISPDQTQYNSYVNGGGRLSKADWRRSNVNNMVKEVQEAIHAVKPWVKFGISPAGVAYKGLDNFSDEDATLRPSAYNVTSNDWQYDDIFSDPIHWIHERTVDFISPQIYWLYDGNPPFKGCCEWWTRFAKKHDVHFYASHSLSYISSNSLNGQSGYDSEKLKIDCVRKEGTELDAPFGSVYYSMRHLIDDLRSLMASGVYKYKALPPEYTKHNSTEARGTNPGTITGLTATKSGSNVTKLSWTAKSNLSATQGNGTGAMRYTVYAIPTSIYPNDATDTDGGIQAQYLLGMTYSASMDIPAGKRSGYYYVVHCLDRDAHEWEASYYGDVPTPPVPLEVPALLTPDNNVRITDDTEFSVENVMEGYAGEKTVIQISRDATFSYGVLEYTGTYVTVPYLDISEPGTYYWRARVDRSGVESVYTDVRTFHIIADALLQPTLYKPDNGTTITEATNFITSYVTDDPSYTELQIYDNAACQGTPVLSTNVWEKVADSNGKIWLQHLVNPFEFGNGTYYWRVYCTRKGAAGVSSETRSFIIGHGATEVGYLTENGYELQKDATTELDITLSSSKKADLQSMWIRKDDINPFAPLGTSGDIRDICVRPADSDQARDIVYLSSKSNGAVLKRLDARTGEYLGDITLNFDSQWTGATYVINGVCIDSKNRLYVHSLGVANAYFLVGVITDLDEANRTANVKTILAYSDAIYRFDHARVYGDLMDGTGYIMAIPRSGSNNYAYRWTVTNGTVNTSATRGGRLPEYIGIVPYIHPISETLVLAKASSGTTCRLVDITNGSIKATATPGSTTAGGVTAFNHGGDNFVIVPARDHNSSARTASGMAWGIYSVNNPASSLSDMSAISELPAGDYMGTTMCSYSDYGAPVVYMQSGNGKISATGVDNATTTYIYGLCNENGVAAYRLTTHITTGAEDISVDNTADSAAEYYTLQGVHIPAGRTLAPGIYIRRTSAGTDKVVIK